MTFSTWLAHGFFALPWWGYALITLGLTHITILTVTIFLHRCQAHRALELHASISHFFRFWLWLTTGMITHEWVAIHRKHHAFSDKPGDPHSPHVYGIAKVLGEGVELYQAAALDMAAIEKYGKGTPNDWLEQNLYTPHHLWGIWLMLGIDISLFGVIGISVWALQMLWIPLFAAGVVNGLGHWFGYRNFESADQSRNLLPWGIFIGGEELHNNHHTFTTSAKLSVKWYELDYGWLWIKILSCCQLAQIKKAIPIMHTAAQANAVPDLGTLEAVISNRYALAVKYAQSLKLECRHEIERLKSSLQNSPSWGKLKTLLTKDKELLTTAEASTIKQVCQLSPLLQNIFSMRAELSELWARSNLSQEQLVQALQAWCQRAETSGIENLKAFSWRLRSIHI